MTVQDFEALLRGVLAQKKGPLTAETYGLVRDNFRRVRAGMTGCCPLGHYLLQLDEPLYTAPSQDLDEEVSLRLGIPRADVSAFTKGWDQVQIEGGGPWYDLGVRLRQEFLPEEV